ncbi:hypothetical protein Hanom_Chr12g01168711 [Helianthus anomalus]
MQLRSILINGNDFAAWLANKRFSAASRPVNFCISLIVDGEGICSIACTLSGLTLNPSFVTMNPRNFPSSMPKEHFAGFSLILTPRSVSNVF